MRRLYALGLLALALAAPASTAQPVTGLSGWSLYLDPGHSQNENVGVFGYSEARKTLRVALALRDLLTTQTDIAAVYLSRTDDSQVVSLAQRVDDANARGASYFHSVHSNAGAPASNNLFVLWAQRPDGTEGIPNGGRRMATLMGPELAEGMRIPAANGGTGAWGECDFYGASSCRTGPKGSRNYVQSFTVMASTLSEAGFHTNPRQNQLNMNADWKRLEAQAMFWSILDYHTRPRPEAYIATGIVADAETGRPVNGATVTVGGRTYTTDTYESLFHLYSNDPGELANGFYYLDGLAAGTHAVSVTAPGYRPYTGEVAMRRAEFSFHDAALVSTVAPVVTATTPVADAPAARFNAPLTVTFSRKMDPATTGAALSLAPTAGGAPVAGTPTWSADGFTLTFTPAAPLAPETAYTLTIAGTAVGIYGDALDGNGDGTPGDAFSLAFTTGGLDVAAPRLTESFPSPSATGVDLRPVVTVAFNEVVDLATLASRVRLTAVSTGSVVPGAVQWSNVAGRTTVSLAPTDLLAPSTSYRFTIDAGVRDLAGNATASAMGFTFTTGTRASTVTVVESFDGGVANWWQPQQSGSTTGVVTDSTGMAASTALVHPLGGTGSMRVDYGWLETTPAWLIRQYLGSGPPFSANFDATATLQASVYGDGSGTLFRFAVDEGCSGSSCSGSTEVSPWVPISWYGWRVVSWTPATDGTGTWIGNGTIDGRLRFDSFQLSKSPESARFGAIWIDDLRTVQYAAVAGEDGPAGGEALALEAPRPNPSRGDVQLGFRLGAPAEVTVRVFNLIGQEVAVVTEAQPFAAGAHTLPFDGRGLAAGVYLARVEAAGTVATARFVITR